MAAKNQRTGMRGVFLVAAELASHGFVVCPTSRNAFGADLLVTAPDCRRAFSVQVKTNATRGNFWLLNKHAKRVKSPSHVYVFVALFQNGRPHEFYIVPSRVVAKRMYTQRRRSSTWRSFDRGDARRYQNRWSVFGRPK